MKDKYIYTTSKGRQMLSLAPSALRSPILTAKWEQNLNDIAKGNLDKNKFLYDIINYTKLIIKEIKSSDKKFVHDNETREKCPDCVSIFMLPPSLEVLEKRLRGRHTDGEEVIKKRLKAACGEIMQAENYDYVIVNDTIAGAVEQINLIIAAEKLRFSRSRSIIERMLNHAETIC